MRTKKKRNGKNRGEKEEAAAAAMDAYLPTLIGLVGGVNSHVQSRFRMGQSYAYYVALSNPDNPARSGFTYAYCVMGQQSGKPLSLFPLFYIENLYFRMFLGGSI